MSQAQQKGQIEDWVIDWYRTNPKEMEKNDKKLYEYARYWHKRLFGKY